MRGVLVGHHQRTGRGWQTGTTVIFVPDGAIAAVDVRGGGPGTRETDALDPRNLVDRIHAVCLTGGSAYGLAAADGVMAELESRGLGVPVGPGRRRGGAGRAGRGDLRSRPGWPVRQSTDPEFGERALRRRRGGTRREVRSAPAPAPGPEDSKAASVWRRTRLAVDGAEVTVAALAVVNAAGHVIDPATGLPFQPSPALKRPTPHRPRRRTASPTPRCDAPTPLNTTIGVVATDADLTRPEAGRMAKSAHDGLARAIRPAHRLVDGDTIFALATGGPAALDRADRIVSGNARLAGQHNSVRSSPPPPTCSHRVPDAVLTATTLGEAPAYRDLCPSAFRAAR